MKSAPAVGTDNRAPHLEVLWRGLGLWKWPCLLLLMSCIWLTPKAGPSPGADTWWELPKRKIGPMEVHAATSGQLRKGAKLRVQLHFANTVPKRAACRIADADWREVDLSATNPGEDVLVVLVVPETVERFLLACKLRTHDERSVVSWDLGRPISFAIVNGMDSSPK